jgi:ribosomal protein S18 acetylase RimI-like enzyme
MTQAMLTFRQLALADMPALLELQEIVRQNLPDPHLFQCEDEQYYARVIAGTGAGFGAFDGKIMAGYGIVTFPGVHPENLCHDVPHIGIDPTEAAHLDGSAVHVSYRGLAIQQRLSVLRIAFAADKGARHFLMTIAPGNPHSLRNHLNGGGFRVRAIKQKYGGLWRLILHRELDSEEPTSVGEREYCGLSDIEGHRRLLEAGFSGIRMVNHESGWQLAYEKW